MKVINIPETVRIGYADYKVEMTKEHLVMDNTVVCYGMIDYSQHIIKLNEVLGDVQQIEATFLHEVLHGIIHDRKIEIEDEEVLVDALAKGLRQLIRDNPDMFKVEETILPNVSTEDSDNEEILRRLELKEMTI